MLTFAIVGHASASSAYPDGGIAKDELDRTIVVDIELVQEKYHNAFSDTFENVFHQPAEIQMSDSILGRYLFSLAHIFD